MDSNHYELTLQLIISIRCTDYCFKDYPLPTLPICLPMQYQYVSIAEVGLEPTSSGYDPDKELAPPLCDIAETSFFVTESLAPQLV